MVLAVDERNWWGLSLVSFCIRPLLRAARIQTKYRQAPLCAKKNLGEPAAMLFRLVIYQNLLETINYEGRRVQGKFNLQLPHLHSWHFLAYFIRLPGFWVCLIKKQATEHCTLTAKLQVGPTRSDMWPSDFSSLTNLLAFCRRIWRNFVKCFSLLCSFNGLNQ